MEFCSQYSAAPGIYLTARSASTLPDSILHWLCRKGVITQQRVLNSVCAVTHKQPPKIYQ